MNMKGFGTVIPLPVRWSIGCLWVPRIAPRMPEIRESGPSGRLTGHISIRKTIFFSSINHKAQITAILFTSFYLSYPALSIDYLSVFLYFIWDFTHKYFIFLYNI